MRIFGDQINSSSQERCKGAASRSLYEHEGWFLYGGVVIYFGGNLILMRQFHKCFSTGTKIMYFTVHFIGICLSQSLMHGLYVYT